MSDTIPMIIVAGHTALLYWSLLSCRGGLGPVHGMLPLMPEDLVDLGLPRRRGRVPAGSPSSEEAGLLERLGLMPNGRPAHLLVRHSGERRLLRGVHCISYSGEIPARSLYRMVIHGHRLDNVFVCSPELALMQHFAQEQLTLAGTLTIAMELCGSYRLIDGELRNNCPPLTSSKKLRGYVQKSEGIRGRTPLTKALPFLMEDSASPAETSIAISLSLPLRHGGARLGKPVLNKELALNAEARSILRRDSIRPDMLFAGPQSPSWGFPLEYESRLFHSSKEQAEYDELRRNTYAAMGSGCFLAKPENLASIAAFDIMAAVIARNIGTRLSSTTSEYAARHRRLLAETLKAWWERPN